MRTVSLPTDKVSFTFTTDLHLSAIPPGRRRDDYATAIFNKIEFQRNITEKIKGIALCGADIFHFKKPDHPGNSVSLIVRGIHTFGRFPSGCIYGWIGNHDLEFDRMDSLSNQPLGILIAAGVYHNLVQDPVLFKNQTGSVGVLVESFPYEHNGVRTLKRILEAPSRPPEANYRIGIVHQYGAPGDRASLWGTPIIGYNELVNCDYDFLLWGHDHSRKETVTIGSTTHINLGSLARAALPTDEDGHKVVLSVLSFSEKG